jgi:hypothetical protein
MVNRCRRNARNVIQNSTSAAVSVANTWKVEDVLSSTIAEDTTDTGSGGSSDDDVPMPLFLRNNAGSKARPCLGGLRAALRNRGDKVLSSMPFLCTPTPDARADARSGPALKTSSRITSSPCDLTESCVKRDVASNIETPAKLFPILPDALPLPAMFDPDAPLKLRVSDVFRDDAPTLRLSDLLRELL